MKTFLLRAAGHCALLASTVLASPALAQMTPSVLPPETVVLSPGGVDLVTGTYRDQSQDLSIGAGSPGGITFVRANRRGMKPVTSNWQIEIEKLPARFDQVEQYYSIRSLGVSKTFVTWDDNIFYETGDGDGSKLQRVPSTSTSGLEFLFTAADGTTTRFSGGVGTEITRPDGVKFTIAGGRVTSNTGYELLMEFGALGQVTKACVLNNTITASGSTSCPVSAPTVSYTYDSIGRLTSATDPTGAVSTIAYTGSGPYQEMHYKPGQSQPWLTNTTSGIGGQIVSQAFADGRTFSYTYEDMDQGGWDPPAQVTEDSVRGTGWTENGQTTTTLRWGANTMGPPLHISPGPMEVNYPLGRTVLIEYQGGYATAFGKPTARILPNGRVERFEYEYQNVTKRTLESAASGEAPLITSATYDVSLQINRAKPTSITDPRGAVTTFVYDPTHGGLVRETGPAVNGVQPQKRYTYAQRYARVKNSAGNYVPVDTPVWLLTSMSFCKTGNPNSTNSGCANSGDQVVTTYDYGPDSGANNLLLRGTVVDAGGLSLRTCFAYDASGNKISETEPKAGLSSCQ